MGLLRADLHKLVRHALLKWLVIALLGLVLLRGVVWPPDPDLPWSGLWSYGLVAVALVALTAINMGLEFSEDTFRSMVSRGVPKWRLLVSKFAVLVLTGGVLLLVIEGLATLLSVRSTLHWGDLGRAWLSLWPYVGLIMLLTVLSRNGGLALVVGVLWLPLELLLGTVLGVFATIPLMGEAWFFSAGGPLNTIYQATLTYNSANWTYLGELQRAPGTINALLWATPRSTGFSLLVLAAYLLLGVGLSIWVVYRRDVTEVVEGERGLRNLVRRRRPKATRAHAHAGQDALPAWTGRGPAVVRLLRANLFKMWRTALIKIGMGVSLFFPLALWGAAKGLKASGFQDLLFSPGPDGGVPMAITASLLAVGPLATVLGILTVSTDLSLGTRRAELARGVTPLQAILAQSLTLVLAIGTVFAFLMAVTLLLGFEVSGMLPVWSAALTVLVAMLAAGAYIGASQVGGALSRSPLGAMLFGLGFLLADWVAILAPTLMVESPGLLDLGRYGVFANTFALANRGEIIGVDFSWQHLGMLEAVLLLLGYAAVMQGLAVLFARMRDA
jgi:ABC-type transport system involved in multi-copper enzyme maturation permease subunit